MDIYLKDKKSGSKFTFPAMPEKIKVKAGSRYQTYEIIGKGTVKVPKGLEAGTISWTGIFYGKAKKKESMIRKWTTPANCKKKLNKWMEKGKILKLLVTDTSINYDVTISDFEYEEYGAFGNAEYTITFVINKELKVYTTKELKIASYAKKTKARSSSSKASSNTYTVVSGDTLWAIAQKFYGSGSEWQKIYDANSKVIESTAQKYGKASSSNGHWIYPGTALTIP